MGCTNSKESNIHTPTQQYHDNKSINNNNHITQSPVQSTASATIDIQQISTSTHDNKQYTNSNKRPSQINNSSNNRVSPDQQTNNNNTNNNMTTPRHQHSIDTIASWLRGVPLLSKLNDSDRVLLAEKLIEKQYIQNQIIFSQGDIGHGFYIVISGEVEVSVDNNPIATLHAGDYFGEQALISNNNRAATCKALTNITRLFYLSRDQFISLFGHNKLNITFVKRAAISAESGQNINQQTGAVKLTAPINANYNKTQEQIKLIYNAMSTNILFMNIDHEHKDLLIQQMYQTTYKQGQNAIIQGDYGDNLYIVETGLFDVIVNNKKVASRGVGSCFGELALMYNAKRAATVTAVRDSIVFVIDRFTFRRIVTNMSERKYITYINFLKKVELLNSLAEYERKKIAEALDELSYNNNHVIFKQNDIADAMYIVYSGSVKIVKKTVDHNDKKQKIEEIVQICNVGQVFGERALHTNETRAATAITQQDNTILLRLDRAAFVLLLGPLDELLKQRVVEYKQDDIRRQTNRQDTQRHIQQQQDSNNNILKKPTTTTTLQSQKSTTYVLPKKDSLQLIGTLGKGSFGFVQLVQDPMTKITYALKAVNKSQIVQTGQQHHVISEKQSMMLFDHPFLIKLYGTYKDTNRLYFLLQPVLGGELFTVLRQRTLFDESTARFYAAQIVCAFDYMHNTHDIIYRDLKPENILLDNDGYIKITDFGFAKHVDNGSRTWTLCGTPDYLSPEIVSGRGHGRAVDWWTLGIFIYEMLASYPPFYDDDQMKTYSKIMNGQISYPHHFSHQAIDLISKLLQQRVSQRLGMLANGVNDIKQHPWFKSINFNDLLNKKIPAPILPKIKHNTDLTNFESYGNETQKIIPYQDDGSNWDSQF